MAGGLLFNIMTVIVWLHELAVDVATKTVEIF